MPQTLQRSTALMFQARPDPWVPPVCRSVTFTWRNDAKKTYLNRLVEPRWEKWYPPGFQRGASPPRTVGKGVLCSIRALSKIYRVLICSTPRREPLGLGNFGLLLAKRPPMIYIASATILTRLGSFASVLGPTSYHPLPI